MAETPSPSSLGKKPKWYLNDEEISRLPSRIAGMDANSELRCRREAAEFIQEMAERLNHNVPPHRGQINQNCICIAMVHMHRFFLVHSFTLFPPKDVAAACLFLAGKSEECPRKLEHVVEIWFKLKYRKAEVQPPFNETVRKNGAELIVYLESVLLQTIGFELHVDLPHPVVIKKMQKFKLDDHKLVELAYWFATDIIQLTNWCIRFNEKTIACVCIFLACTWADYEIPGSAGAPWFKCIDQEMTDELLTKLSDEFTLVYKERNECHAHRFIQKAKNANPATMPAKAIAQLPPPPPPPMLELTPKKTEQQPMETRAKPDWTPVSKAMKRSPPKTEIGEQNNVAAKKLATANNRVDGLSKNSNFLVNQSGDQIQIPQVKQEVDSTGISPASSTAHSTTTPKTQASEETGAVLTTFSIKKKIGLSEYKQRLKVVKTEPSDSPAASQTPTPMPASNVGEIKNNSEQNSSTPTTTTTTPQIEGEKEKKRQSFMPDLSNASSSSIGAESLSLPIGIPLVEKEKKRLRDGDSRRDSAGDKRSNISNSTFSHRSHHHHREHTSERSHEHHSNSKEREKHNKTHHWHKERTESTKIYLNGVSSADRHKNREKELSASIDNEHRQAREQRHQQQKQTKSDKLDPPPPPHPSPMSPNGQPPPPPPSSPPPAPAIDGGNELEEGELA